MTYILNSQTAIHPQELGGKATALAKLRSLNLAIPPWFVVSPRGFERSLNPQQQEDLKQGKIASVIADLAMDDLVKQELESSLDLLCPNGEKVAVRSSAVDEDGEAYSFAGQLESFLFVSREEVIDRVVDVWRSGFSDRLLIYRQQHQLNAPQPPAVLIQKMVNAEVAGVAFGADPVTGQRGIVVISAVKGVANTLVSGEVEGETYRLDRQNNLVSSSTDHQLLKQEELEAIATLARQLEQFFGRPQDIEWALENQQLYLLQSRPITRLSQQLDPDGQLNLWDNSNISESYSGVTTPLTFSFARRAYEEVYRQFCLLMGVSAQDINNNAQIFSRMIGLIQGRVYYNLLSWYKVLSLLPGFQVNRQFMEQMMGVKEGISNEALESIGINRQIPTPLWIRLVDTLKLASTVEGLLVNFFLLNSKIKQFYLRLDRVLNQKFKGLELNQLRADELIAHYRELERELLRSWDAPLINDFFAMIFYGVLQKLTQSWCGDRLGTLQNDLISGEGGMISAEPAIRVKKMARIAAQTPSLVQQLRESELEEILEAIETNLEFKIPYEEYLEKFGDRCLGELKLESPTLVDNPLVLLRSIGQLASTDTENPLYLHLSVSQKLREAAEIKVSDILENSRLKTTLFNWVLQQARARVRERENLRFERTRLFGHVRRIFIEVGKRLESLELLDHHRDIFYLELPESLGFIEGTSTCTNLKSLVELRKEEFQRYREAETIGDRFETRGIVYHANLFQGSPPPPLDSDQPAFQGLGCCPGIVKAPVKIIQDPENAILEPGTILVAERTDPGWIMLFPAASGLLVERGSLLSHSAIVAREMGIPAIVSLPQITQYLADGDWVEMDGSTGKVQRLSSP